MQKRRTHQKSRKGCSECKRRHVKCDEQGPPCANCVSRKTTATCYYKSSPGPASARDSPAPNASASPSGSASANFELVKKPPFFDAAPELSSLLQLELMHRWSTSTYKSLICVPPDTEYMQVTLPQGAFQHSYVLKGILAVSALELAASGKPNASSYFRKAMQYYNESSASFRQILTCITKDNIEFVYTYSAICGIINSALLPGQRRSALDTATTVFELQIGSAVLARRSWTWLNESGYGASIQTAQQLYAAVPDHILDEDTERALTRLGDIVLAAIPKDTPDGRQLKIWSSTYEMYTQAVAQLRRCFCVDVENSLPGFCVAFPAMVGPDLIHAIKRREPLALLITMHWALLMDRLATFVWWAEGLGRGLVLETSEILLTTSSRLSQLEGFYESIGWANEKLGIQGEDTNRLATIGWVTGLDDERLEGIASMPANTEAW